MICSRITPFAGILLLVPGLSACSQDIMRGYIGRSPEAVMARYGPPIDVRNLPDGRRAYQWMEVSTTTTPGSETSTIDKSGRRIRTEHAPSTTETDECFYTFYARRDGHAWVIEDFAKPRFGC